MKSNEKSVHPKGKPAAINSNRPEIRDNLDSRENLEQNEGFGGQHTKATHKGDHAKTEANDKRGTQKKK